MLKPSLRLSLCAALLLSSCRTTTSQLSEDYPHGPFPREGALSGFFLLWGYPKPGVFKYTLDFSTGTDGKISGTWNADMLEAGDTGAGPDKNLPVVASVVIPNEIMQLSDYAYGDPKKSGANTFNVWYLGSKKVMLEYLSGRVLESPTRFKDPRAYKGRFELDKQLYAYTLLYDAGQDPVKEVMFDYSAIEVKPDGSVSSFGSAFSGWTVAKTSPEKNGIKMDIEEAKGFTPPSPEDNPRVVTIVVDQKGISSLVTEGKKATLKK